ncbi:MAG: S8 family serine peptidase [Gammaproteobacteria bacterium]
MNQMKRRRSILSSAVALALLGSPSALFAETAGGPLQGNLVELDEAWAKVGDHLSALHGEYQSYLEGGGFEVLGRFQPSNPFLPLTDGMVVVDLIASGDPKVLLQDIEALGLEKPAVVGRVISGRLPITAIEALTHLEGLRFARPAYSETNTGAVDSQGDRAMRSDIARADFGVDGSGLTVGVLSDSFNCLGGAEGDVASGDLPTGINVLDDSFCPNGTDEGRAMMQLIHDVAPGASLAFHTSKNGMAGFANGIRKLRAAGAHIIVDDVVYFTAPFFQDGIIAQAVDEVVEGGAAYFSSAANYARLSYEVPFRSSGRSFISEGGDAHDFDPGEGIDIFQRITLPEGVSLGLSFQWDEPFYSVSGKPGAGNDLDICLTDEPPTRTLACNSDRNVGQDSLELLFYENPEGSGVTTFNLVIEKHTPAGGPDPGLMKYIVWPWHPALKIDEYDTASSTVVGHANAAGAEAVGAAFYQHTPDFGVGPPRIRPNSSAGSAPILFDHAGARFAEPVILEKPNVVAPDGTNTTFFGSDIEGDGLPNFSGTSAAAPHAAGVAALLLQVRPSLPPVQVYEILEDTAIDMDDPATPEFDDGFDFGTGYGLIQADAALNQINQQQ